MIRRAVIVVAVILVLILALLFWMAPQKPGAGASVAPPSPASNTANHASEKTKAPAAHQALADVATDSLTDPVPPEMLDGVLEAAAAKAEAEMPRGVRSGQIPEDNALHWFLLAAELMPTIDDEEFWKIRDEILEKGWRDDPRVIEQLQKFAPAFEAIRKGLQVGNMSFPDARLNEPMPYLAKWRELGRMMDVQALMDSSHGNYDAALDNFATIFQFANESSRNAFIITNLVGYSIQHTAAQQLIKTLQSSNISAKQCRNLIDRVTQVDQNAPRIVDALTGEVNMLMKWFNADSQSADFQKQLADAMASAPDKEAQFTIRNATPEQFHEWCKQTAVSARQMLPLFEAPVYQFDKKAYEAISNSNVLTRDIAGVYGKLPETEARVKMFRSGVLIVAALEAFRREQGAYPDSLGALASIVPPQTLLDPFSGRPFHYESKFGNYRLYSDGPNLRDDHGAGKPWDFQKDDFIIQDTIKAFAGN